MSANSYTNRREVLAGLGGLAAGALLAPGRVEAGSLEPPGPPAPTMLPLADIEPRTIVNAVNTPGNDEATFVISKPGSYYLTDNLLVPTGKIGILIDADDVTLDLMRKTVQGGAAGQACIRCGDGGRARIAVRNGSVNFHGIDLAHDGGQGSRVDGIMIQKKASPGIVVGDNSLVLSCSVVYPLHIAFVTGDFCIIAGCSTGDYGGHPGMKVGRGCIVSGCLLGGNRALQVGPDSIVRASRGKIDIDEGCLATGNTAVPIGLESATVMDEALVRENLLDQRGNSGNGMWVHGDRNVVADNRTVFGSHGGGPLVHGTNNLLLRNTLRNPPHMQMVVLEGNSWRLIPGPTGGSFDGDGREILHDLAEMNANIFYNG